MKKLVDVNNTSVHIVALEQDKLDLKQKIIELKTEMNELNKEIEKLKDVNKVVSD